MGRGISGRWRWPPSSASSAVGFARPALDAGGRTAEARVKTATAACPIARAARRGSWQRGAAASSSSTRSALTSASSSALAASAAASAARRRAAARCGTPCVLELPNDTSELLDLRRQRGSAAAIAASATPPLPWHRRRRRPRRPLARVMAGQQLARRVEPHEDPGGGALPASPPVPGWLAEALSRGVARQRAAAAREGGKLRRACDVVAHARAVGCPGSRAEMGSVAPRPPAAVAVRTPAAVERPRPTTAPQAPPRNKEQQS